MKYRTKSCLSVAMITGFLSSMVLMVFLVFVFPRIEKFYEDMDIELNALEIALMDLSRWLGGSHRVSISRVS